MDLLELLPAGIGGGGAVAIIAYLLASNRADRSQATERIKAANLRADAADRRAAAAVEAADAARLEALNATFEAKRLAWELERIRNPSGPPEGGLP